MRLLHLTSLYPEYITQVYHDEPQLAGRSYSEQLCRLDSDLGTWASGWGHALARSGYEVADLNANVEPLQRAWAREQGLPTASACPHSIVAAQIARFAPSVLYLDDYSRFDAAWIAHIREANPCIRLVLGWCGGAFADPDVLRGYDVVLSCVPEMVERFRVLGLRCELLDHGFAPEWLSALDPAKLPSIPVSFIGQLVPGAHDVRIRLLERLVRECPLELRGPLPPVRGLLRHAAACVIRAGALAAASIGAPRTMLERVPALGRALGRETVPRRISARLRAGMRPALFGRAMLRFLRDSCVSINCHTDISPRSASNMRLFEATGVGSCLLTDARSDLARFFEPDREVVTYGSAEECLEKIRWLDAHPAHRTEIAAAGQRRTLTQHTLVQRAAAFDQVVRHALSGKSR